MNLGGPVDGGATDGLLAFRRRVLRLTAQGLAVGMLVLAVVVPALVATGTWQDAALLSGVAMLHTAAAVTVGRRWEPGGTICGAYLVATLVFVGFGVAISTGPQSDAFWFLLVPLGLSALTMSARAHAAIVVLGLGVYVAASAAGPGLAWDWIVPRSVAAILFSVIFFGLARRLEQALVEVGEGRRELQEQFAELEIANARMAELDLAKDEFVSTLSHELRTPLTSVIGMTTTLDRRWEQLDDQDRRRMMDLVARNARGIEGIVSTLLDLARIERGGFVPARDPVDVSHLARDAVARLEPVLRGHDLRLELPEGLGLATDGALLERVVDNLLVNAARHTPTGTAIHVRAHRDGETVRFEVADEGPGIEPEEVARLGERFHRAGHDGGRHVEGVGIGLALVGDVLAALGTKLEIASAPGEGSSFAFRLPAVD